MIRISYTRKEINYQHFSILAQIDLNLKSLELNKFKQNIYG